GFVTHKVAGKSWRRGLRGDTGARLFVAQRDWICCQCFCGGTSRGKIYSTMSYRLYFFCVVFLIFVLKGTLIMAVGVWRKTSCISPNSNRLPLPEAPCFQVVEIHLPTKAEGNNAELLA
ncbi:unnamed protein product, partial [Ectocarpus sp. 8 AP-2014]